jgi:hypothetical protein
MAAVVLAGVTAAPASAWPIPLTPAQINFLNQTRGNFPGDDDAVLTAGLQVCHGLYTGQNTAGMTDQTAANYGVDPGQAAALVRAARRNLCPTAPG